MGWFDDLSARVEAFQETEFGSTISDYLADRAVDAVIRIGEAPTGNLTPAQIAAGQRGGTPPVVAPTITPQTVQQPDYAKYLPYLALAIVAVIVLKKAR